MKRLVSIIFALSICMISEAGERLHFNNISTEAGLSNKMVLCIAQDNQGFMWFGTAEGLNRFDGYDFRIFRHIPGDTTSVNVSWITCLTMTRSGQMWVGTEKGINIYNAAKQTFERYHAINDPKNLLGNLRIRTIYEDAAGNIWIGTTDGLIGLDPATKTIHRHTFVNDKGAHMGNEVRALCQGDEGTLWVGTFDGLYSFDTTDNTFVRHEARRRLPHDQDNNFISSIYRDPADKNTVYVGTSNGLAIFDQADGSVRYYRQESSGLTDNDIKDICRYDQNNMVIATANGVSLFNIHTNSFSSYNSVLLDGTSLPNETVWSAFQDRLGVLWLGTNNGLAKVNKNRKKLDIFRTLTTEKGVLKSYAVNDILITGEGDVWLTCNYGIMRYDSLMNLRKHYSVNDGISHSIVKRIIRDSRGVIWIGTNNGINYFDSRTGRFRTPDYGRHGLPLKYIYDINIDNDGDIVVNINSGICFITPRYDTNGNIVSFSYRTAMIDQIINSATSDVTYFKTDRRGNIWIGTINDGLFCYSKQQNSFKQYKFDPDDRHSINSNRIYTLHVDDSGTVWIGTDMGLCRLDAETGVATRFSDDVELSQSIRTITSDHQQRLWIGAMNQLIMFDYEYDRKIVCNLNDDLDLSELVHNSFFTSDNGQIYMGGDGGFIRFNPTDISLNLDKAPVVISSFSLWDKKLLPRDEVPNSSLLQQSVSQSDKIRLRYDENTFSISFALLNYASSANNRYSYILEGHDKAPMIISGSHNYATYSNIPPGHYVFTVKAANPDGVWTDQVAKLDITIMPPWWASWWAYCIYILIGGTMLYVAFILFKTKIRLSSELKLEKLERIKMEELNQIKMKFFTNVSHEFKTPLSLILGPIESLEASLKEPKQKLQLNLMRNNAERLLRLINQIMDLRKFDNGKMSLDLDHGELVSFTRRIFDMFTDRTEDKKIGYEFHPGIDELYLFFDADKMEKVLYNLISNSVKFTPEGGNISVLLDFDAERNQVKLTVSDTGVGIGHGDTQHIFDRFYQQAKHSRDNTSGSGIGLALTKDLVEMHQGEINFNSIPDKGSDFVVVIPCDLMPESVTMANNATEIDKDEIESDHFAKFRILVVEDNQDMLAFLKMNLEDHYEVYTATNGESGLALAKNVYPDLILSDVMMPEMDGFQLCSLIKKDIIMCHIPVILLTARNDELSRNKGYECGADGYIYKPFSIKTLLTRIDKMIELRKKMQAGYRQKMLSEPSQIVIESDNDKFLNTIVDMIEGNMDNPDFGISDLCANLGYSSQQIYRKIKALTGETINEFIRTVRLKRAAQYLQQSDLRISEIMYKVGFNSHSYFTKCFREHFGISPKEYLSNHNDQKPQP